MRLNLGKEVLDFTAGMAENLKSYQIIWGGGEAMAPSRSLVPTALNNVIEDSLKTFRPNLTKCSVIVHRI